LAFACGVALFNLSSFAQSTAAASPTPLIAKEAIRSGSTFPSAALRAQQKDDDQNPGMLWVDQGREIFARDCSGCHTKADGMAARSERIHTCAEQARFQLP
jgi:mono/diheme cytochrome c family protein